MTKEMAIVLLGSKDVYLTKEGRQFLEQIIREVTSNGVSSNSSLR